MANVDEMLRGALDAITLRGVAALAIVATSAVERRLAER